MKAIIVSDLHIGSRYFLRENFKQFLQNIPQDNEFILNGDIINNSYGKMKPADLEAMSRVHDAFNPTGRLNPGKLLPT